MNTVTVRIDKVHSYGGLVELLESPFLDIDVISRAALSGQKKVHVDDFDDCCVHLIRRIQQFSIYRSILSKSDRYLRAAGISTWMEGNEGPIAISLMHLRLHTVPLVDAYEDFGGGVAPIFCCGNKECNADSGHMTLYRCRGCKLALYCGVDCQKQDWWGTHELLCNAMKQPGQAAALPPISSPDIKWLAYILAREFIQALFTPSGLTACDSAGHFTSLLLLN
ncbi:hypothetical protein FIBSPDRAFT_979041 [Athelia psychrophila]|uniref:MYND-type domain-containing protein n=1 Tax=Athelia psychrophila TaxID=1759441 RepID=A0A166TQB5_9AGAM|nr:hypothetical protein FIBSPDRAFT_979041 [Fibularhizoctonia sp. CBS 109695]